MHKNPEISLIICTHNRDATLNESLTYYNRIETKIEYEVIVVLNACTDSSEDVVKQAMHKNPKIRIVNEPKPGLSNARNRGWKEARSPFVFYIDDDAYPQQNIITLLSDYDKEEVKCISGVTKYWDANSPTWIKAEFVEVPLFRETFGKMPEGGYINGCACGFNKQLLADVGGFDPSYGMVAKKVGYYDEVLAQRAIQENNTPIYYDPNLAVYHQSHCKTADQFLKSAYYKGVFRAKHEQVVSWKSAVLGIYHSIVGTAKFLLIFWVVGTSQALVKCFSLPFIYFGQAIGK